MPIIETEAQFITKLLFLRDPHPYKILYGGRDGMKSWSIAQQLVINLYDRKLRWLCCREIMNSMKESVHQLLSGTIKRLGLEDEFEVLETAIRCKHNGSEFVFAGLKNAKNIKSYEDCDGAWVEEAQTVSKSSWEILLPTIRKEGSEIWAGFNPDLATDDTYIRWVLNHTPGAMVVKVGWRDNVWLSQVSRARIEHLRATDPLTFEHIYEGMPRSTVEGAIFGSEMAAALKDGRICSVPYNRARPVDTVWDLGYGDLTTVWFLQAYDGWYNFIDYLSGEGKTIADYLILLQQKQYLYGCDWLPHDGVDTIIHAKLSGQAKDRRMSIEQLMREAGRNVRIAPKLYITDRINAARTIFPQCRFDSNKCADGLQSLRHYQWGPLSADGVRKREPLHNEASHGADAFCVAGVSVKQPEAAPPPRKPTAKRQMWS